MPRQEIYELGAVTMAKLTFQQRLDCPHSFNSEDNKNLQCDYEFCEICDGTLYEHCLWDMKEWEGKE